MQRYWVKIALGALAVFGLGMGLIVLGRRSIRELKALAQSDRPIGIPLALMPFQVGGDQLGSIRRFELLRSSPKEVSGIRLTVRLNDSASVAGLRDCVLTLHEPAAFARHGGFGCVQPSDSAPHLEQIGEVVFEPGGMVRAIFAPADHAARWRGSDSASLRAELTRLQAERLADSAARVSIRADSARSLIEVRGESSQALVQIQADSQGARMRIRDRSGREVFGMHADSTGASLSVLADSATPKR
jgi:hypothetical protein